MRPLRLELEGFTSFRERVCIDFENADLFVLTGPMGAGKSSIIDAMGFALYGSVARFDNKNLVAPVISQGLQEARVRLDFMLGDEEYSAVRVVRRNKTGGASTPEARLQRGEIIEEDFAEKVTDKVTELLGLNFEQFTKCVVLPQGDFADFLHARPADRQELLVRLLDIGLYRKIGERARERSSSADERRRLLQDRLDTELRNVSEEAYKEHQKRVKTLQALHDRLTEDEARLAEVTKAAAEQRAVAEKAELAVKLFEAVRVPAGVDDLVERVGKAEAAAEAALLKEEQAQERVEKLDAAQKELPQQTSVEMLLGQHIEVAALAARIGAAEKQVALAAAVLESNDAAVATATAVLIAAETERNRLERADSAYHASQGLKAGDICPVCGEKLTAVPSLAAPKGAEAAAKEEQKARTALQKAQAEQAQARDQVNTLRVAVSQGQERLTLLREALKDQPDEKASLALVEKIRGADRDLSAARQAERIARVEHQHARQAVLEVQREQQQAWSRFQAARDPVASSGAPAATEALGASWQALYTWAQASALTAQVQHSAAVEQEQVLRTQEQELRDRQAALCAEAQLSLAGRPPLQAVMQAAARAEQELASIDEKLAVRQGVERDFASATGVFSTTRLLATHLRADHFERWYLQEALGRLVRGASVKLLELTNNQYSLDLNANLTDFVVIDHINANEQRPVRTLSGGETFLASLALALALGDDIATLAANGASRLDALFLDEGFGALDANTLETVASTIEDLGARGRMVGIITHVQELADRIPVQYLVSKAGGSSRVERKESS